MTTYSCKLPDNLAADIAAFEGDLKRFLAGELAPAIFKAKRVPRGVYEQRRDGTYMVRVRIPGGALSTAQARVLAELGRQYGSGALHVTTRQDIQFHDVQIADVPAIMRRLLAAGLTCKGGGGNTVRNVAACPYAGVCSFEKFDVTPYALAVTEYLITLTGSYNLPRKYKIAFSGCGADCALTAVNDLGFIAEARDGRPGFRVYAGGGMGVHSRLADELQDWLPATEVIRVAETVRRLFDRLGDRHNKHRARLRFVFEQMGLAAFRRAFASELAQVTADSVPACRVNVDLVANPKPEPAAGEGLTFVQHTGLQIFPQRQRGYVTVPFYIPLGFVAWQNLAELAEIAEKFSAEKSLRATQTQGLLLGFVPTHMLADLAKTLAKLSVDVLARQPLANFVSCAGASTCRLGLCLSRNAAAACAAALEKGGITQATLDKLDIRISGCPNSCGQHPVGTIGLFGVAQRHGERLVPSYGVLLAARRGQGKNRLGRQTGTVPARALPAFLLDLLGDFQAQRNANESFADYYDRREAPYFKGMLERYQAVPDYAANREYYRDWDQAEDFSLAGRGPGECGAGVFEVVTEDITAAKEALSDSAPAEGQEQALFKALLATVRALLIVRGIDSSNPDEIIRAFETHFIDLRLVSDEFRELLARGRGYQHGWREALAGRKEEIQRLLARVELLFAGLDANLNFHPPDGAPAAGGAESAPAKAPPAADAGPDGGPTAHLDLRGVACPMNFVKARLKLETMAAGDVLRVTLDDGEPVQNVPASFRNEGQEVLGIARLDDDHWQVDIRKKQ